MRNVRDSADVVLYLVNAAETPEDAGYLAPELAVLAWIGKPVIVLLNQTGRRARRAEEAAEIERWRDALLPLSRRAHRAAARRVRALLGAGVRAVRRDRGQLLPAARRPLFARLAQAWRERRWPQFDEAMAALAAAGGPRARRARAAAAAPMLRRLGEAIGVARADGDAARQRALEALARALDDDLRAAWTG